MSDELGVDDETRRILDEYGFDAAGFARLRAAVADGSLSPASNVVTGAVEPPPASDITPLPAASAPEHEAGLAALAAGEVGSVVLNGGMATRFGGRVKGVVEAVDGKSFLEIKLAQSTASGAPAAVMTSFATDAPTREFLTSLDVPEPLFFSQAVSLRLEASGDLFRTSDGRVSPYAPGHGDFLGAFRSSGVLAALQERGVKYVMVSNVDNLPATLDPLVIGAHILGGRPMTVEVTANHGEVGGAPARVDGKMQLLESMRFPAGFDHSSLPVTNVNTVTFDVASLDREFDLTWLYVQKKVEGRSAVQLEHLFHEASAFLPTTYLEVPVTGPDTRFIPVKTPDDLTTAQPALRAVVAKTLG